MSLTRVLINLVGFFILLDGCLGVTSPDVSKMLMIKIAEKVNHVIIRILSILCGTIFSLILYGAITSGPNNSAFIDYLLMFGAGFFSVFYIILAFTLPANLRESDYIKHLESMPNSRYRIYEAFTLGVGLFLIFISVRY